MQKKNNYNQVKKILIDYGEDKKRIYIKGNAIKNLDNKLDMLQAGWSSSEPTQGGGTSQEDKVIKLLDKKKILEKEIEDIRSNNYELKYAIKQLDNTSKVIIYNVWINRTHTMRQQAKELYMSKSTVYNKSELAIKKIYKIMKEQGYNFNKLDKNWTSY